MPPKVGVSMVRAHSMCRLHMLEVGATPVVRGMSREGFFLRLKSRFEHVGLCVNFTRTSRYAVLKVREVSLGTNANTKG